MVLFFYRLKKCKKRCRNQNEDNQSLWSRRTLYAALLQDAKKNTHAKESKRANTAQEPEEAAGCY